MRYDVAIIGAGMSGLAAAIRLAHFDKKVCLLERHNLWGGLNSFYKKEGHRFDSGLHALTNWVPAGRKSAGARLPLERVTRQLRIPIEAFELEPHAYSEVVFLGGETRLRFENGLDRLSEEIAARFPREIDGFRRFARDTVAYPDALGGGPRRSARRWLEDYIADPLLREMILCPLMFYGCPAENDLDVNELVILFNSIFREGLSRPRRGVRGILDVLMARLKASKVDLKMRTGVRRLMVEDGRVSRLILDDEREIEADLILSSAGHVETARLRSDRPSDALASAAGRLAFFESIWVLDRPVAQTGAAILFVNDQPCFAWEDPAGPIDLRSGVVSIPGNFGAAARGPSDPRPVDEEQLRVTHLANSATWFQLDPENYALRKQTCIARAAEDLTRYVGDFRPSVRYTDAFTPRTITRWTGHLHGAVYGSPDKQRSGRTDLSNLFICGTDQGMLGIVGAMHSGISVANAYGLAA